MKTEKQADIKKIGILTYFWAHNSGTFLQAFSMLDIFRRKFPDTKVELIDVKHRKVFFKPGLGNLTVSQFFRDIKRHTLFEKAKNEYLKTGKDSLVTKDSYRAWEFIDKQGYDLIVVGSDTILQFLSFNHAENSVPVYWLPPSLKCKKVMCAASCGGITYDRLSKKQRDACRESLNGFDLLGVRDDATLSLMNELGVNDESKLSFVPDPTFAMEIDYCHSDNLIKRKNLDFSKPSIGFFLHRKTGPAPDVANYFRNRGYQIIALSAAGYADICLTDISPFEWAGVYKGLQLVITGAFHGAVFSLKNLTPVLSFINNRNFITANGLSKYRSLMDSFDLGDTNIIDGEELNRSDQIIRKAEQVIKNHDKDSIQNKLTDHRKQFELYIEKIRQVI